MVLSLWTGLHPAQKANWVICIRSSYELVSCHGAASHWRNSEPSQAEAVERKSPLSQSTVRLFFSVMRRQVFCYNDQG